MIGKESSNGVMQCPLRLEEIGGKIGLIPKTLLLRLFLQGLIQNCFLPRFKMDFVLEYYYPMDCLTCWHHYKLSLDHNSVNLSSKHPVAGPLLSGCRDVIQFSSS